MFLFFLVIATGLFGSERPVSNLTPTFVWIIWWVGMGFVVSLLGNLWAIVNPWKILFGLAEAVYHRFNSEWELTLGLDYAEKVGVWPSVALFFAFVWVENALPEAARHRQLLAWAHHRLQRPYPGRDVPLRQAHLAAARRGFPRSSTAF